MAFGRFGGGGIGMGSGPAAVASEWPLIDCSPAALSEFLLSGSALSSLRLRFCCFFSFFRFLDAAAACRAFRSSPTSSLLPLRGSVAVYARPHTGQLLASVSPNERFFNARFDTTHPHGRIATNGTRPSATQWIMGQAKRAARRLEEDASAGASPAMADAVTGAAAPPCAANEGSGASRISKTLRRDLMCPKACCTASWLLKGKDSLPSKKRRTDSRLYSAPSSQATIGGCSSSPVRAQQLQRMLPSSLASVCSTVRTCPAQAPP